jgi:hypothetical protein
MLSILPAVPDSWRRDSSGAPVSRTAGRVSPRRRPRPASSCNRAGPGPGPLERADVNSAGALTWKNPYTSSLVGAEPNIGFFTTNASDSAGSTRTLRLSSNNLTPGDIVAVTCGVIDGEWRVDAPSNGFIFTSEYTGDFVWGSAAEVLNDWTAVACSADGSRLVAAAHGSQIYTSRNFGANWTARESNRAWTAAASSSDGSRLVAAADGGQIYTSSDYGATWTSRETSRSWSAVASSADGTRMLVVASGGIWSSGDCGVTWKTNGFGVLSRLNAVASPADGTWPIAASSGQVYFGRPIAKALEGGWGTSAQIQYLGQEAFVLLSTSGMVAAE